MGDRVITPRIGKPVEVEALWLNALSAASYLEPSWRDAFDAGRVAFLERFWNQDLGRLADVVDVDHVAGSRDDTLRPNQIFAVGGLPVALLDGPRARRLVDVVEQELLTPIGLRSLGRAWLCPAIRRRCVSARCGVSPGHGLAVADWPVR
jgi:predicted glycogen debranching enzyme